ncbi:YhcN/YlaJ family sporulation lipoprotein [Neobacillus sp. OS1-2]|uniref:YhcN/YlaJ family sporulation lipoprotein n=1 Tax=Neobacillus sp. OS1-2 TaxID=3070680 RepID=UPI0027DF76E5|nr:YhcN/YlaJ family sporulation lipoprotein [Neobacillus sp. OS1-2]WML40172.1 YhcN/YlaJ family sporulation lipoprotein [Neobacillus sp. OS1-2]
MKKSLFVIGSLVFSLYLSGCARNDVNDNVAYRNRNTNEPTRVNYNTPNNGGPAITGVDTSNRDLDRTRNNITNVRHDNRNNVGNNQSKIRIADKAADKVTNLPEVDHANIIVTDNNAYVAAKLDPSSRNELTTDIENKISRAVKSVDADIDNVYISVNPDFYDRMNHYASDIRNGKPISGFVNEFSDTIRRVFPDAR